MKTNKISFCTVCMNRLHHLKLTLPSNIKNNLETYPNIEFVIFDYNSTDGLEEWIKSEMKEYIDAGVLNYYKTSHPLYFDRSHSRNVMFRLAQGDIICNLDADNFTGENFAKYINEIFSEKPDCILLPDTKKRYYFLRDALGRFCARKEDFMLIRGYDEKMTGYGFEDDDLYERLLDLGREEVVIQDLKYLTAIKHQNDERIKNEYYASNIHSLYISYISDVKSEIIILYKDANFEKGYITPNHLKTPAPVLIEKFTFDQGKWEINNNMLSLNYDLGFAQELKIQDDLGLVYFSGNNVSNDKFHLMLNELFLAELPYSITLIKNQSKYLLNRQNRDLEVNTNGFGKDRVMKNYFSEEIVLN